MKSSNFWKNIISLLSLLIVAGALIYLAGCGNNSTTNPAQMTDDQFLQQVIASGYNNVSTDEDNLMANERYDMNDSAAVPDQGGPGPMTPIDSLIAWGRVVENVNLNLHITTSSDDSVKTVTVTRTITGHYIIVGRVSNQIDTIKKPYTEVLNRDISFKRVNRYNDPRLNWRLYQISLLSGGTTSPQPDTLAQMVSIQVTVDNNPPVIWNGPDFTQNKFTTIKFNGEGIPRVHIGSTVVIQVTVNSTGPANIVAWHWARNTFGFHRVPFTLVSSTPGGRGYINIYQKTFYVYPTHKLGCFNGYINASTRESLYDDDITLFSSSEVGIPYKVTSP